MANERRHTRGSLLSRHRLLQAALRDARTSKGDCQVLEVIAAHANHDGSCYPGIDRIASETGIHRTTVIQSTKRLEEWGYILIEKSMGRSNFYQLQPVARALRVTSSADATGSKPSTSRAGTTPPVASTLKTSSADATRTQLLNSVHRTQGASPRDLDDQGEAKKQPATFDEIAICTAYRQALESDPRLVKILERNYWAMLQRKGLIEEGRMRPLAA